MAKVPSRILMDDDYLYEQDFDEDIPYISMDMGVDDVRQIHESISIHLQNWVSCTDKKERLEGLKDFFERLLLEYTFRIQE
jgi:hypothetical protein